MSKDMSKSFNYTTTYTLDKPFFAECYDQTSTPSKFPQAYIKGLVLFIFGVILLWFKLLPTAYVGWFIIALSFIDVFSVYYKRGWWLSRQMLSMAAGNQVELSINAQGLSYKSGKNTRLIEWADIDRLEQTELGFVLHLGKQRQYLSQSCLSPEALAFVLEHSPQA